MDFESLEAAWRSPANTPDDKVRAYLMETLMRTLKARRRGEMLLFAIPATAMTLFTALMARTIAAGRMDIAHEWAALAMMAICWLALLGALAAGVLLFHVLTLDQAIYLAAAGNFTVATLMFASGRRKRPA